MREQILQNIQMIYILEVLVQQAHKKTREKIKTKKF